jgi:2-keto-4-pentenoate hydratase/2-oxohepta-3-ene-1,7-dioic acid hydratase in catechol pathway
MIAHRQPVIIPQWATRVDYEGELGVVIGKKMKGVDEKDVPEYIMGCTCFNDITERDVGSSGLINQDISKCCDTFGPCGPWICTEVDPDNAELKTILNGKVVQQDNYANTVFSTRRILSELSQFMTL